MESLFGGLARTLAARWSWPVAVTASLLAGALPPQPVWAEAMPASAVTGSDAVVVASDGESAPQMAPEPAVVRALRTALGAGNLAGVQAVVGEPTSALARWLDQRLQAHLTGTAVVSRWDVQLVPLFGVADVGQLRVTAALATGDSLQTEGPVRLLAGGRCQPLTAISAMSLPIAGHTLQVRIDPATGRLAVTDTLATKPQPGRTYLLRLAPALTVSALTLGGRKLPFTRQGDTLVVVVPAGTPAGPMAVTYGGIWPTGPYDFIQPQSVLLRPESTWYPQALGPASPVPFKTTLQVAGLTGMATGQGVGKGVWQPVRPVNGVAVAAGRFVAKNRTIGPLTVSVQVDRDRAQAANAVLDEAVNVLTFATAKLGAYPFKTLTICETDVAGGYGGEGLVSLGSRVMAHPRSRQAFLAHEILHAWTDRLLARGTEGEIGFLSEALTTYLAYQYVSRLPGNDPVMLRQAMAFDYSRYAGQETDVAVRDAQAAAGTGPWFGVVYQKGAMVLHDLYRHLGDQRFWAVVKSLNGAFAGKPVRLADLQHVAEKVAGEPLGWWFAQWTERAGAPHLALQDVTTEAVAGGHYRLSGRVTQGGVPYRLKVPLVVTTATGSERYSLTLVRDDQPFAVTVPAAPVAIQVDPDYQILMPRRRPPTLATTRMEQVLIVVGTATDDLDERQAAEELAKSLTDPLVASGATVTSLADTEVTAAQLAEAPVVLLVGRPAMNQWTAKVPALPVRVEQDRFTVAGITYDRPTQGIVETLADVWRPEQVVTVFSGLGAPALKQMAGLRLGQSALEIVVSGDDRVLDAGSYSVADPELTQRLPTDGGS